jgi:two-component system repressor protein LuxO
MDQITDRMSAHRAPRDAFCDFIGASPVMQHLYEMIEKVAASSAPVLIGGESGTGKELAMRAIHALGARAQRPSVVLNCAAIPHELLESELFGHARGAFTGATADRLGAFQQAHLGALFLDEVGELPLPAQAKLLRVLQTGEVKRVGENHSQRVDVRIVAATHRDLREQVQLGLFRDDLFYRLHVVTLRMPPLRERGGDVGLLATRMLQRYAGEEGKRFTGFSVPALAALARYAWPGNVRELINFVRATVALHDGPVVEAHMLPEVVQGQGMPAPRPRALPLTLEPGAPAPREAAIRPLAELERSAISEALAAFGGNVRAAAQALGINASTLYRKLQLQSACTQSSL